MPVPLLVLIVSSGSTYILSNPELGACQNASFQSAPIAYPIVGVDCQQWQHADPLTSRLLRLPTQMPAVDGQLLPFYQMMHPALLVLTVSSGNMAIHLYTDCKQSSPGVSGASRVKVNSL